MHVAYVLLHFPYLTETFVAEEIRALRKRGVDIRIVSLLAPGNGPVQRDSEELLQYCWYVPGVFSFTLWRAQFYYILRSPLRYFTLLWSLLQQPADGKRFQLMAKRLVIFLKGVTTAFELRNDDVDLLHTHFAWLSGAATWVCARLLDRPYTVTTHAYDIYASNDLLDIVTANADRVFTISAYNRQQISDRGRCAPESIEVIHCGIDLDKYETSPQGASPSANNDKLNNDKFRILSVGSLNEKKGHEYLIQACKILHDSGLNLQCDIIGGGSRESHLHSLIRELGVEDIVRLRGALPHESIVHAFASADLFVLACVIAANGDRDGIPVSIMEAGVNALPIVSTNVSGIPELVRDGETGIVVTPENAPALAEAIFALAKDEKRRRMLGENAKKLVLEEFNSSHTADHLLASMDSIVNL